MTTDISIDKLMKNEKVKEWGGVWLYDQIDKIQTMENQVIIINYVTTEESQEGKVGHFVVLDNRKGIIKGGDNWRELYYFDGYGLKPDEARDIMHLPNTRNISRLIERLNKPWDFNNKQFQVLMPNDELCGFYSSVYVLNPNFKTNPTFKTGQNRVNFDKREEKLMIKLGFIKDT
jgi:hypothetical protein